jgi:hypothetical protein
MQAHPAAAKRESAWAPMSGAAVPGVMGHEAPNPAVCQRVWSGPLAPRDRFDHATSAAALRNSSSFAVCRPARLVVAAEAIPEIQVEALARELEAALT